MQGEKGSPRGNMQLKASLVSNPCYGLRFATQFAVLRKVLRIRSAPLLPISLITLKGVVICHQRVFSVSRGLDCSLGSFANSHTGQAESILDYLIMGAKGGRH